MTLPPIVERELRVGARRSSTFQIRFVAAVGAALLGGVFLLGEALPGRAPGSSGRTLFQVLTGLSFGLSLLAGPLLTADCLSREKREGTLGFLFLTDLSGFEIVTGKFAALAMVPLHGLLALFPVAALTVFMGGVTGGELARVSLVVTNTLFLSLAAGMWVSSLVDDERQAVGLTVGSLLLLGGLPELLAWVASLIPAAAGWDWLRLASPAALLRIGRDLPYQTGPKEFWWALLGQHALGWMLVLLAATVVRQVWRDRRPSAVASAGPLAAPGTSAGSAAPIARVRSRRSRRLLQENPIAWLAWHDSWLRRGIPWLAVLGGSVAIGLFVTAIRGPMRSSAYEQAGWAIQGTFFLLKVLLATHAVYLLNNQCRQGTLEILLSTPLYSRTFADGHLAAMRLMVLWPALALGTLQIGLSLAHRLILGGDWPSMGTLLLTALVPPLFALAIHAIDLLAVAHHASRWALHYDRPAKALLRTILLVLVLPALFCGSGRVLVSLIVIGQNRPHLDRFRELTRRWFFPGTAGWAFGAPRVG